MPSSSRYRYRTSTERKSARDPWAAMACEHRRRAGAATRGRRRLCDVASIFLPTREKERPRPAGGDGARATTAHGR
ncbi:hypothetical protein GW17_00035741 [Ensete ventricosum]|nr:hypothetical protein GW17_00035741 [Ensete ventricosum]